MAIERGQFPIQLPLFDVEPAVGAGGTSTPTPDATPTPTPSPNPAPGAGDKKPVEDPRIAGLIADLQKERKARQDYETRHTSAQAELDKERKRVRAMAGLETPSADEEQAALVKSQFKKFFPHLADLTDEDVKALRENKNTVQSLQKAEQDRWNRHAFDMVGRVEKAIGDQLGGDKKLTERQQRTLRAAYVQAVDGDDALMARHARGDESLVADFAKEFIEDWLEPMKRKAAADAQSRFRPVPNGKDRGTGGTPPKKIDYNDPKAVEDALLGGFLSRGGQFTGRR